MPIYCCVSSCKNNTIYNSDVRFYEFPKVWKRTSKLKQLSELRIQRWSTAINRKSINTKTGRVCSIHFHSGKCAKLTDPFNPDWVPSLHLGPKKAKVTKAQDSRIPIKSLSSEAEGRSAHLKDHLNPDWVPSLHLGYQTKKNEESFECQKDFSQSEKLKGSKIIDTILVEMQADDVIENDKDLDDEMLEDYLDEAGKDSEDNEPAAVRDMGINCCVPNCKNVRCKQQPGVKFFRFPSVKQTINGKIYRSERLSAWINAINRIDITHLNAHYKIICSEHFETGAPANACDKSHTDWIPNRKLPTTLTKAVKKTFTTVQNNKLDPWDALDPLAEEEIQVGSSETNILLNMTTESIETEIQQLRLENAMLKKQLIGKDSIIADQSKQLLTLIESHKSELQEKDKSIHLLETTNLKISLSRDGFKNNDKKVNYFTGFSSFAVLEIIYNFVKEDLVDCLIRRINKFDAFILVLMKLRLDLPLAYLGYRYGIAGNTTATIFHTNLKMLSEKIGPFIRWPEKTAQRENTPVYFRRVLDSKFVAFLDFIEDPGPKVSQEYITQKKYVKHKYLIAISPAGAIIFVSKGYDRNLSAKEIAESCGVLDYTDDGDIIISDHGTITHQVHSYNGSKVLVPPADNQADELLDSPLQNPNQLCTNGPSESDSCRVHIQRTISNLINKFFVLTNKQKIGIGKSYKNTQGECYFDYVVRVCCALINVSPTILSFETKKS